MNFMDANYNNTLILYMLFILNKKVRKGKKHETQTTHTQLLNKQTR